MKEKTNRVNRFRDSGQELEHFFNETILIRCSRCDGCATLSAIPDGILAFRTARRNYFCRKCGWQMHLGCNEAVWKGFHPFLSLRCCSNVLYAWNLRHLDYLEAFVSAKLRERPQGETTGYRNRTMASRLPRWMQLAHNRMQILSKIGKLREMLAETETG